MTNTNCFINSLYTRYNSALEQTSFLSGDEYQRNSCLCQSYRRHDRYGHFPNSFFEGDFVADLQRTEWLLVFFFLYIALYTTQERTFPTIISDPDVMEITNLIPNALPSTAFTLPFNTVLSMPAINSCTRVGSRPFGGHLALQPCTN